MLPTDQAMGLLGSACCKHKLRISLDQQGKNLCSSHTMSLFNGEGPVSHYAHSCSCPHRAWAFLVMQLKALGMELRPLSWTLGPYWIPVFGPGKNVQWGLTYFLLFLSVNFPDKHTSSSLCFIFSYFQGMPYSYSAGN